MGNATKNDFRKGGVIMKMNPPKFITWLIALILGVLGIILYILGKWAPYNFWLVAVAFVLFVLASFLKGL
jgi:phosphatidylglycerophosphate synthase